MPRSSSGQFFSLLGIQYLRGIAALSVLLFHTSETYQLGFELGAAGVDVFFVISGLIMWIATHGRSIRPAAFLSRRITRVVPVYWLATLATFALLQLKPQYFFGHDGSPENLLRSLFFIPEVYGGSLRPVVLQGWTLCYEMFFYVLFAISLLTRESSRPFLLVAMLGLVAAAHLVVGGSYPSALTNPIILEFAAGLLIGTALTSGKQIEPAAALGCIAIGVIGLVGLHIISPELPRFLAWGVPSALIVMGVVFIERTRGMPEIRWLHFLGDASYSLYIWHVLTGVIFTGVAARLGMSDGVRPIAQILWSLTLTMAAYLLIERPLNQLLHLKRREAIATA